MANTRDDFPTAVKEALAQRVGFVCSKPDCRKLTIGPKSVPGEAINTGVAAHITAAAPGGKRYDPSLTPEERKSFDNGIWLCQICAHIIDVDESEFTVDVLRNWKIDAENAARQNQQSGTKYSTSATDLTLVARANLTEQYAEMLSDETDKTVEAMRNAWREGKKKDAKDQLSALKSNYQRWNALNNKVKAKVLRFEASLVLDENDLPVAKGLADQAYNFDPLDENQSKIRALIARRETGVEDATQYLRSNKDIDSRNMLAAFYLELGETLNSQKVLDEIDPAIANAETYRLLALSRLFRKDINQARLNIARAEQLAPHWYSVKLNRVMIDYFSVISEVKLPDRPIVWPEPVTPDMVKQDKKSVACLQNAIRLLEELSQNENKKEDVEFIKNWQWACWFVNPIKQDNLGDLIRDSLKLDPTNYYLIVWALELNYEFDFTSSEKALANMLGTSDATLSHVIALAGLFVRRAALVEAEQILLDNRHLFTSRNADALWAFWIVQVLGLQEKVDAANDVLAQFEPDEHLKYAKGLVLAVQAKRTGDNSAIIEYLEQQFNETKHPPLLLQLCRIKFSEHNWSYIAERAKSLLGFYQTPEILRFVLRATYNAQKFELCLDVIEENKGLFSEETPGDIRKLKALCLRAQGSLKNAILEMESLPQSTEILLHRAEMSFQMGDLEKFSLVVRELSEQPDLGATEALYLAHYIRPTNPELAKKLFRKAEPKNLPAKYLGTLLSEAFNLGLDRETKPIHQLIGQTEEEETGIELVSLADLKDYISKSRTQTLNIQDLYMKGTIPVHFFAQNQAINLVDLYHTYLDNNEQQASAFVKTPNFIRHGGKPITNVIENPSETNLYMDVTSILLAEHFNMLETFENAFKTISIPDRLIYALTEMRNQLLPNQPSQLVIANQLVTLAEQNKLKILDDISISTTPSNASEQGHIETFIKYVKDKGGTALVFNNFINGVSKDVSDEPIINVTNVVASLLQHDKLSDEKYAKVLDLFGTEGEVESFGPTLEIGMTLYCWHNTIDLLATAGIMELVCHYFDVYVQSDYLKEQRGRILYYNQRSQISNWLGNLIEKLRQGIEKRKYCFTTSLESQENSDPNLDPFDILKTFFTFRPMENTIICADDRYINSFSNRDGIPIVGFNDILFSLFENWLDKKIYYSLLNQMRSENLLFIPINADEIYYFLLQAHHENTLKETPDLLTIKSYYMRTLELAMHLQKPAPNQANEHGEVDFLLQYILVPQRVIEMAWEAENLSTDEKVLFSNWVFDNVFVDYLALLAMIDADRTEANQVHLTALEIVGFLIRGVNLFGKKEGDSKSTRAAYFNWIYIRLIGIDSNLDTRVLKGSIDLLKGAILENKQESLNEISNDVLDAFYQNFCFELPSVLRIPLEDDNDFMAAIGVQYLITIEKYYQFDPDIFWHAVGQASVTGEALLTPKDYDHPVSIRLDFQQAENSSFAVYDPKSEFLLHVQIPEFGLLNPRKRNAISFLKNNPGIFDCPAHELNNVVDDLFSASSPRLRMERFLKWQKLDLVRYYTKLFERLRAKQSFAPSELLPPSVSKIARFHRISTNIQMPFHLLWKDAVDELMKNQTIEGVINRIWGIPIALPDTLYARVDRLDQKRKRKLIKALLENSKSPISMIHLTKLLLHLGQKDPVYKRLGLQKLSYMLSDEYTAEVKAFTALLRWTSGNLRSDADTGMVIELLASWSHTHQLYSIFKATGAPIDWILKFFSEHPSLPAQLFDDDREIRYDISNPNNLADNAIVVSGVAYCTAGNVLDLSDEFRLQVANHCLLHIEKRILPNPFFMNDVMTLTDHLGSIWSGDRGSRLAGILGEELSGLLSSSFLFELLQSAIDNLKANPQELRAWVDFFATTKGICIPENLKETLVTILIQTNYNKLFEKDLVVGGLAFHLASIVAYRLEENELTLKLSEQLMIISQKLGQAYPLKTVNRLDAETQQSVNHTAGILLEVALCISKLEGKSEDAAINFVNLGKNLAMNWDYFAIRAKSVIQTICEILPPEQSKHIWRLFVFLRNF